MAWIIPGFRLGRLAYVGGWIFAICLLLFVQALDVRGLLDALSDDLIFRLKITLPFILLIIIVYNRGRDLQQGFTTLISTIIPIFGLWHILTLAMRDGVATPYDVKRSMEQHLGRPIKGEVTIESYEGPKAGTAPWASPKSQQKPQSQSASREQVSAITDRALEPAKRIDDAIELVGRRNQGRGADPIERL